MRENIVLLKSGRESKTGKNRVVYYDIESFGSNVVYIKKGNVWILNPSSTKKNSIFFVVRLKDISSIPNLQFHTELGKMINKYQVDFEKHQCFVLLSIIFMDKTQQNMQPMIKNEDIPLMKRYFINQITTKKGNYHFNTTGTIYGLGYGPKCNKNEFGHSIGKFANHIEKKKISTVERTRLTEIDNYAIKLMESTIGTFNVLLSPIKKSISPLVNKLQTHLDVFPDKDKDDRKLADNGFISYNLCLNAQTEEKHTECDASYTIISVPNQLPRKTNKGKRNVGRFELIINENCRMVIPMDIGISFTYSGYLLTHRQQVHNESQDEHPLVNVVSYNSKRLFENMLQSFRRYIGEDKKTHLKNST